MTVKYEEIVRFWKICIKPKSTARKYCVKLLSNEKWHQCVRDDDENEEKNNKKHDDINISIDLVDSDRCAFKRRQMQKLKKDEVLLRNLGFNINDFSNRRNGSNCNNSSISDGDVDIGVDEDSNRCMTSTSSPANKRGLRDHNRRKRGRRERKQYCCCYRRSGWCLVAEITTATFHLVLNHSSTRQVIRWKRISVICIFPPVYFFYFLLILLKLSI